MPYKNTIEAAYIQLNDILQKIAEWGAESQVRNIDIDLAISKIQDVYDILLSLKEENKQMNSEGISLTKDISKKSEKEIDFIPERLDSEDIKTLLVEESLEKVEKKAEDELNKLSEEENFPKENESSKNIVKNSTQEKTNQKDSHFESSLLGDKYANDRPTLNEELSAQVTSSDLANQLKNKPITNLSSAIGLNEKFELINLLFHGDKAKYEETIETLNMAANFNEAYNYLSAKLNWDMSDPLVQRLLDLIRRKLIVK